MSDMQAPNSDGINFQRRNLIIGKTEEHRAT